MTGSHIERLHARQIFDSRGRPTVEIEVSLADGSQGRASAPSGASTGRHEAHELRDRDPNAHAGMGVRAAVRNANDEIAPLLRGHRAVDQRAIDGAMREADGTPNLGRLGANAVLATSLAVARAAATSTRQPLHTYLTGLDSTLRPSLPMPMVNILSGGAHAAGGMDFQDFLMVPVGAKSMDEAMDMIARVRSAATEEMRDEKLSTLLADEGGLSPGYPNAERGLDLMLRAFSRAGLEPGTQVAIAIDVAASEFLEDGAYHLRGEGRRLSGMAMVDYVGDLCRRFPVVSVEDPLGEDDWEHWQKFTAANRLQIVGDDLFVTNTARIEQGIASGCANGVLIKLNQNGTLTGTLDAIAAARRGKYATIISARSGETEDAFIADFAVATGAGQIKIGSLRNSERLAKYNQLLRIAEDGTLPFAGRAALG